MSFRTWVLGGRFLEWGLCALVLLGGIRIAVASEVNCGELPKPNPGVRYGPYDYRSDKDKLTIVEIHHFTSEVENLRKGTTGPVEADLAYTIDKFPNHHRALLAMERFLERRKVAKTHHSVWSAYCWYDRAVRWRPDDSTVRVLFGTYLAKQGNREEALVHLQEAEKAAEGNSGLAYNLGLAYVELKDYDKALQYAHQAYQAGFQFMGLKARLERAGKWRALPEISPPTPEVVDNPNAGKPK